jgi:hypothetical protein
MTPEELAFEFAFFSASQCVGELRAPTRPAKLASGVFVRDFEANCRAGEQAVWQLFSWQAAVPDGAAIRFYVATADAESALAAAPYALLGIADRSTTTWTSTNHTVDTIFREQLEPPDVSRRWLRMKAVFVPNGSVSPTLSEWRAVFNCIPNE